MKLSLSVTPGDENSQRRREAFRKSMQASGWQPNRTRKKGTDTYPLDLDAIFPALLELRNLGITPTEFQVDLDRSHSHVHRPTEQAHKRRVAAIAMALLTVNDLDQMGHFAADNDLCVVVEALLLLLRTTQQELTACASACCQPTTENSRPAREADRIAEIV